MAEHGMTHAVRRVVCLAGGLAVVCLGLAGWLYSAEPAPDWRRWVLAIAVAIVADLALVRIRRGATKRSHNWRETALIVGFVLLPPGHLVFAMVAAELVALALHRMRPVKLAFNTSVVAIESTVGALSLFGAHLYHGDPYWRVILDAPALLRLLAASAVTPLISVLLISAIVGAERSRPIRDGVREALPATGVVWTRNVMAALAIVAVAMWSPIVTVVALVVLVVVHVFSADRTAIRQERFAWHRLQEAIDQLRDVELQALISDATAAAATMMRADAAEIQLYAKSGYETVLRASDIEDAHTPTGDEAPPGHSMDVALSTREGKIGELRLLFTQPVRLSETEHDCLTAFANALAVALANALKFDAIRDEAYRRIRAAYVDPVTGVGNLMMLEEESRAAIPASHQGNLVAIAVIGLNRFAEVNDLLGAQAADQMLRAVATRLSGSRPSLRRRRAVARRRVRLALEGTR